MTPSSSSRLLAPILALLVLAACSARDPSAVTLTLGPASITIANPAGDHHVLAMAANGEVQLDGVRAFTVTHDGRIRVYPKLGFQLTKDDSVLMNGQLTNVGVRGNATFVLDGEDALVFASATDVAGPLLRDINHEQVKANATLTYDGSKDARRAMMFALAVVLTRGAQLPPPPA